MRESRGFFSILFYFIVLVLPCEVRGNMHCKVESLMYVML